MKEFDRLTLGETIRTATADVFSTMLGVDLRVAPPVPKVNSIPVGVMSFVGIAGSWTGTGSLVSSPRMACRIASQLLMDEFTVVNEEVLDAFAELTNMIVGNVKNHLEEQLGPMGLSVPTALFGRNFVTRTVGAGDWTVVCFEWDEEQMQVRVTLASQSPELRLHLPQVEPGLAHQS
jgi:chemotaxis protein CheX